MPPEIKVIVSGLVKFPMVFCCSQYYLDFMQGGTKRVNDHVEVLDIRILTA